MPRLIRLFFALLLAVGMTPTARAASPYTVSGVAVDARAESGEAARAKAIAQGQRTALETLAGDPAKVAGFSDAQIDRMVAGIQVADEKIGATRYRAALTVRFRPESVRGLASAAPAESAVIAPATDAAEEVNATPPSDGADAPQTPSAAVSSVRYPLLVVPVWVDNGAPQLWEDTNAWRAAWAALPLPRGRYALALPLGDLADMQTLSAQAASASDRAALSRLAARYGANDAVVATARFSEADAAPALLVTLLTVGEQGVRREQVPFPLTPGMSRESLLQGAARTLMERLGRPAPERATPVPPPVAGKPARIVASVPFQSVGEWVELRARLSRVAGLQAAELLTLGGDRATVALHSRLPKDELLAALRAQGLSLTPAGDGYTLLRTPGQ